MLPITLVTLIIILQASNIRDSAFIIISNKLLWSQALAYKAYRDATTGGKVLLCDIDELYDQFAYGIKKHPLSIKNFADFFLTTGRVLHLRNIFFSLENPSVLLISVKTLHCLQPVWFLPMEYQPPICFLLPELMDHCMSPVIPVGRLSAQNGLDISNYLQKLKNMKLHKTESTRNG